jgi:thiamine biosynthesis lipoprotein
MGTRFEFVLVGDDPVFLRAAGEEALDEVERLEAQLSRFRPDSEISGINARAAHAPVAVEPRLFALLERVARLWAATGGAFDPTVGALMQAYESGSALTPQPPLPILGEGKHRSVCMGSPLPGLGEGLGVRADPSRGGSGSPSGPEIPHGAPTGWQQVDLDPDTRTLRFRHPGIHLDLGAIGKGYAIEQAALILREAGVDTALLHCGTSSIAAIGAPPEAEAWTVAIRHPRQPDLHIARVQLRDRALSVSAPHGKTLMVGGRPAGHVLDPRSGRPAESSLLAAVVTGSATDGDALSTALLILGPAGLARLQEYDPGCGGLVVAARDPGSLDSMEVSVSGAANWELCLPPAEVGAVTQSNP